MLGSELSVVHSCLREGGGQWRGRSVACDSTYLVADATGHTMDFVGLREQVCSGNAAALWQAEARGRPDKGG
jgi:hypothetical protein